MGLIQSKFLLCFTFLITLLITGGAATAQDNPPDLIALFQRADTLQSLENDPWTDAFLRSDAVTELARLAVRSSDPEALQTALTTLRRARKRLFKEADDVAVSYADAHIALVIAAMGKRETAMQAAQRIPYLGTRAVAYNLLACWMLEQGDAAGYQRLVLESERTFDLAVKADLQKDESDRIWPSYYAWYLLQDRVAVVVEAGLHPDPAGELARWAEHYGGLPMEPGIKGECLAMVGYGYVRTGLEDLATPLLTRAQDLLGQDQALDMDDPLFYGTDNGLVEVVRLFAARGQWDEADKAVQAIGARSMIMAGHATIACQAARLGDAARADRSLRQAVAIMLEAEQALTAPDHGAFGENRAEDHPWFGYESVGLFWDGYYLAYPIGRAGMGEALQDHLAGAQTDVLQLGVEIGLMLGENAPLSPAAPDADADGDHAGPVEGDGVE